MMAFSVSPSPTDKAVSGSVVSYAIGIRGLRLLNLNTLLNYVCYDVSQLLSCAQ